jgi:hypothetical protein
MTLSIAWVRKVGDAEELVMATDSRLRFGCAWDCCPKIFTLPRNDCAISFAGDTMHAYPMMFQIRNSIEMYPKLKTRALDINKARGHFLRLISKMRESFHDLPPGAKEPEVPEIAFIFAGYSWESSKFQIWTITYDNARGHFIHGTPQTILRNSIAIAGDMSEVVRKAIHKKMNDVGKKVGDGFDMEPFQVLCEIIRTDAHPAIGGPPQLIKIYKHLNTMPYGIFWPDKQSKKITYLGRPILEYEMIPYPILDPDTLKSDFMRIDNPDYPRIFEDSTFKKDSTYKKGNAKKGATKTKENQKEG